MLFIFLFTISALRVTSKVDSLVPIPTELDEIENAMLNSVASKPKKMEDLVKNVSSYTDFNLLMAAQLILPKADSKDFVDRPTKRPIKEISRDFRKLQKKFGMDQFMITDETFVTRNGMGTVGTVVAYAKELHSHKNDKDKVRALQKFIDENFGAPGSDLTEHPLEDYAEEPPFLKNIVNEDVRKVTLGLNKVWKELSRVKVEKKGQDSTLLSLPYPFIVPGGRFREFYYWDTYFILEGLVVSKMDKTALNIVRNFMHIIDTLGYIPNGTRRYYMYRSQPPFFPLMLFRLLDLNNGENNDLILGEGLEMALKEYDFFEKYRSVQVKGRDGKLHKLNYFHVTSDFPRPESLSEDINTFLAQSKQSESEIYSNLKSGAESGWDFSSRWFKDETDISTINAYNQIPVDLNAILFKNEQIISTLLKRAGRADEARRFGNLSLKRQEAINQVLWNSDKDAWNDYNLETKSFQARRFYFSNIFPLVFGVRPPTGNIYNVLQVYQRELFSFVGGVPVSGPGKDTGQQWDFPNVWAPHQLLIVQFLHESGEHKMALQIARAFYSSVAVGFRQQGVFYEKYSAEQLGFTGEGGEYEAQTGFGWTNGTALSFINKFGDQLGEGYDVEKEYREIVQLLSQKAQKESEKIKEEDSDSAVNRGSAVSRGSDSAGSGVGSAVSRGSDSAVSRGSDSAGSAVSRGSESAVNRGSAINNGSAVNNSRESAVGKSNGGDCAKNRRKESLNIIADIAPKMSSGL